ncbi:MAG: hypothetical protein JWQ79_425 [Mucilaginibacter sp.]|nr:hypothetical protein [Mucilaginibacter sp.]
MKKNIFGILAIIIALGASAFTAKSTTAVHRDTDLKWFLISPTVDLSPTAPVPSGDATYINDADGPTAPDEGCSGTANQCVSGFNDSQVDASTNMLKGTQQSPVDHSSLRDN